MKFYCFSLIVAAIAPLAVVANRNIRGSKLDTNGEINDFLDYIRILGVGSMTDRGDVNGGEDVWMGDDKTPDDYFGKDTKVGKSMKSKREKSEKKSKEKLEKGKSAVKSGKGKSGKKEKVKYPYHCRDLSMYLSFFSKYHLNI